MKRITVLAILLMGAGFLYAQDAGSIMNSTKNRIKYDTIHTQSRMVITAKNGKTSEQVIEQYSKDGPNGANTVVEIQSPANVAGIRILSMATAGGGQDQWIVVPKLKDREAHRIAANENYMGDVSNDDISSMNRGLSLDTHTLLREETLNGKSCYVIQSVPKDSSYQYSKTISWIDKADFLIYKSEMYNRRGELAKVMEMSNFKDVQGRLTPTQTKISTVAAGTSTTIYIEGIKYDEPIPDQFFTKAFLEAWPKRK